ncbi:hypothetical protein ACRRTK_001294 [Alexandromys fortis]
MEKETKWNKTPVDLDLSKTPLSIEKEPEANPADSRSKGSGWDTCQMPYLAGSLVIFIKICFCLGKSCLNMHVNINRLLF